MSPAHLLSPAAEPTPDRRSRLLSAAARAFTASGFKAASLRDIASNAGVSLTLASHHFGSKERLLLAVVARHHEVCRQRMAALRTALHCEQRPASLAELAATWVDFEFDLYASDEGRDYLLLLIKLLGDDHVAPGIRQALDCSEPVVIAALARAIPGSTAAPRARAFVVARGALHAALIECTISMEAGARDEVRAASDFVTSFVRAGLSATLPG
jgi:AcrR family transcriptional regulator